MTNVTVLLSALAKGKTQAADELLALVYDELRRMASAQMAMEKPGHTLQATALVHEAYLRMVEDSAGQQWQNRRHFFSVAAEAMRRILVESARSKKRLKRGAGVPREVLHDDPSACDAPIDDLLDINAALDALSAVDAEAAEVVKLRYFAGLGVSEVAEIMGTHRATVNRNWKYARAWLHTYMSTTPH